MMDEKRSSLTSEATERQSRDAECRSIDWYAEGQERVVEVAGVRIIIRYVGRNGRRGRIAILAPAGTIFCEND